MVLLRRLTRQALSHRSKRRLFAAPALDMRIIEHRSDPLKDAPGRFRDCEPDRRESIADHHARNLIDRRRADRSEEHTSELQSVMRISYAVLCLKKNNTAYYFTPVVAYHIPSTNSQTHVVIIEGPTSK